MKTSKQNKWMMAGSLALWAVLIFAVGTLMTGCSSDGGYVSRQAPRVEQPNPASNQNNASGADRMDQWRKETQELRDAEREKRRKELGLPPGSPLPEPTEDRKGRVSILIQDGKLLYETAKHDEAEIRLREAIELDPDNPAAYHYMNLILEERHVKEAELRDSMQKARMAEVSKAWNFSLSPSVTNQTRGTQPSFAGAPNVTPEQLEGWKQTRQEFFRWGPSIRQRVHLTC